MSNTAFLGNLTYNQGAEFNVLVCDASFEELKQYDEWASYETNGGRTANGIGENIKNCFIVCAPQTTDDVNYVSYVQTTSWTDLTGDSRYDEGKDSDYHSNSYTYITPIGIRDKGDYDLIVTDHLGNLIRLTPPFADYDTRYFSVVTPNNNDKNSYYGSRYITFNKEYEKLLGNTNDIISNLSSTYTPILTTTNEYNGTNLAKQNVTIVYCYSYGEGQDAKTIYNTFSYNSLTYDDDAQAYVTKSRITDEVKSFLFDKYRDHNAENYNTYDKWDDDDAIECLTSHCNPKTVSFVDLMNKIDELTYKCSYLQNILTSNGIGDVSTYKIGVDPTTNASYYWTYVYDETTGKEIGKKIYTIEGRLANLESCNFLYRADKNIASYLWSGDANEYDKFIKGKDLSSYIFLHTV